MKLLLAARVARRRIEVTERLAPLRVDGLTERGYRVVGDKVRDGSLYSSSWSAEEVIRAAMDCARRHNPKAIVRVSWCDACGRGSKPDVCCRHENAVNAQA